MKIYVLLDKSGSMATRWDEALTAINSYIKELAKKKSMKGSEVSLAAFDSLSFEGLRRNEKVSKWKAITNNEVTPGAATPLYDAIGRMNEWILKDSPKKATLVIMTDGFENQSKEVTKDAAKAMIAGLEGKGFDVVFLGADFDAMAQAGSVGVSMAHTLNTVSGSYVAAASALSAKTTAYASTGKVRGFTEEERAKAKGE